LPFALANQAIALLERSVTQFTHAMGCAITDYMFPSFYRHMAQLARRLLLIRKFPPLELVAFVMQFIPHEPNRSPDTANRRMCGLEDRRSKRRRRIDPHRREALLGPPVVTYVGVATHRHLAFDQAEVAELQAVVTVTEKEAFRRRKATANL
jgi:hypothetical protein